MILRRFNENGMEQFANFLDSLTGDTPLPYPSSLLTDQNATEEVTPSIEVEHHTFRRRYAAAKYLDQLFKNSGLSDIEHDRGLWAWLSLFYFDELCPADTKGARKPGRRERWILVPTSRKFYLHQLAGPYLVYRAHAKDPAATIGLLCGPLNIIPRVYEEIAESPSLIASHAVVETATRLYYNPKTATIRRSKSAAGGPRRLVGVLAQFDVTWDISSLSTDDVWRLLPDEFSHFKKMYDPDLSASLRAGGAGAEA